MLDGEKLVKVTKILYSQWMKNNDELFKTNEVNWDVSEDVYKLYKGSIKIFHYLKMLMSFSIT